MESNILITITAISVLIMSIIISIIGIIILWTEVIKWWIYDLIERNDKNKIFWR